MKIRLERDVLAEAVQWVARSLPSRPSVPVLAGLLVRTDDNGIIFSGFDYESSGQVQVAATVHDEGEALVSGKLFADISKQLPNHPVEIEADEAKMVLTCGHAKFVLQTLPLAEYPALPAMPPLAGTVDTSVFNEAVGQVAVAARRDSDSRPMTTSVRVEVNGDRMSLMASDLYRLAYKELTWAPASPNANMEALVKAKTLSDIAKSMTSGEEITISLSEGSDDGLIGFQVSGNAGRRQSTTRLMDHEFPKVRQLLEIEPLVTVRVDTAELIAAARRVALVAESNTPLRMLIRSDGIALEAATGDQAQAHEEVDAFVTNHGTDDPLKAAGFNPAFLLDALNALDRPFAQFSFTQSAKPCLIVGLTEIDAEPDTDYKHVIMLIRLPS